MYVQQRNGAPEKWRLIRAHGTAIGLPTDDDMGNSEVGHNALGVGFIFAQGAKLVDLALSCSKIYEGEGFKTGSYLLDVHDNSFPKCMQLLLKGASEHGAKRIRVHILTVGHDVADGSSLGFVETLENNLANLCEKGVDARIASGEGEGRMYVAMDRYENDWDIVKRGCDAQVLVRVSDLVMSLSSGMEIALAISTVNWKNIVMVGEEEGRGSIEEQLGNKDQGLGIKDRNWELNHVRCTGKLTIAVEQDRQRRTGEQEHSAGEQVQSLDTSKNKEKSPILVILVNDKSRFTYKTDKPGILRTKPDACLALKNSSSSGTMWHRPKIELPFFEGVNPRVCIQKCLKYFSICSVLVEQIVEVATMYLTEEFTKLTQKGSVEDYQEKFVELQPHILLQNPTLTEEFFMSLFISGLRDDIKHRVKALDLKSLSKACKQVKLYELSVEFEYTRFRPSFKLLPYPNPISSSKTTVLPINTPYLLVIIVANGQQLFSSARCNKSNLMDFNNMTLSFDHQGEQICIQGQQPSTELHQISGATLLKMTAGDYDIMGHIILLTMAGNSPSIPMELQYVLEKYNSVFAKPEGLPPQRTHDHAIPLEPNITPINLRPYRFPHNQKDEVEKQIATMLSSSIIQPTRSPFASPYLLIKKKDGTCRFCLDYRNLNSLIIKDKFPISIVEDLLDKLHGAVYFSKIDLRSGVSTDPRKEIEESYKGDSLAQNWISILTVSPVANSKWKYSRVVLRYNGRVYIGATGSLRLHIIQSLHDSPQGGHSDAQATYYRIRSNFYWSNLKAMVATYVRCCKTCQQTKVEHLAKPRLLQPFPIPNQAWEIITMDFIEGLPTSLKKKCILVIVDKFTKYSDFLPLVHPYSAAEISKFYLDNVYKYMDSLKWPFLTGIRPSQMKALEITEKAKDAILSQKFDHVLVNIPNGDIVGHIGDIQATIVGCKAVDEALMMILDAIERVGGIFVVTTDHGNAEDMVKRSKFGEPLYDKNGELQILTSHTCHPVSIVVGGRGLKADVRFWNDVMDDGLANMAATVMNLHGFVAPSDYKPTLIEVIDK
ncbi:2,3-bisphosphoglycerate-independent phosphoglycerate mutase [Hibiscus syriacus]|uniref:phosphoglycerate mutase (2,3-diphosphoglycerate-independent) n=1 Tax=Hibiscus syriacus TaxID=106335 RepID=A0A6A3CQ93_HIBSY|nr:2,3-bisphosphoglycerate-independent phosphoglycerate mutase [Hibiscus syriacus]